MKGLFRSIKNPFITSEAERKRKAEKTAKLTSFVSAAKLRQKRKNLAMKQILRKI